ncbi:MAG: hypothetical protein ACE5OZ_22360 [Candidatus Heimdallarchaeota archaeon]
MQRTIVPSIIGKYIVDPEFHIWIGLSFFSLGLLAVVWLIVFTEVGSRDLLPRQKLKGYAIRLILASLLLGIGLHFLLLSDQLFY